MNYKKKVTFTTHYDIDIVETSNPLVSIAYIAIDNDFENFTYEYIWTKDKEKFLELFPKFATTFPEHKYHSKNKDYQMSFLLSYLDEDFIDSLYSSPFYDEYIFEPETYGQIPGSDVKVYLNCSYDGTYYDTDGNILNRNIRDSLLARDYNFGNIRKIYIKYDDISITRENYYVPGNGDTINLCVTIPQGKYFDVTGGYSWERMDNALRVHLTEEEFKEIKK